jgi:hypothetical protein
MKKRIRDLSGITNLLKIMLIRGVGIRDILEKPPHLSDNFLILKALFAQIATNLGGFV